MRKPLSIVTLKRQNRLRRMYAMSCAGYAHHHFKRRAGDEPEQLLVCCGLLSHRVMTHYNNLCRRFVARGEMLKLWKTRMQPTRNRNSARRRNAKIQARVVPL